MLTLVSALILSPLVWGASAAAAPPAAPDRGRRLFIQCQACHSIAPGAAHKIGPNLHGTVNARAATRPGYAYSAALKKSGLIWNDQTLDRWLANPAAVVPGNKMVFTGMRNPQDRQQLIAYMKRSAR